MASANDKIEAGNLFSVNGLVAVITGGGSGTFSTPVSIPNGIQTRTIVLLPLLPESS